MERKQLIDKTRLFEKEDARILLNKILKSIENNKSTSIITKQDPDQIDSYFTSSPSAKIVIGTKRLYAHMTNNHVRNIDLIDTVITIHHEERHFQQHLAYSQPTINSKVKQMARYHLIIRVIPEYYDQSYKNAIIELDAEAYGIRKTADFFKTNFPEIDIEHDIVENINSYSGEWYASSPITSISNALQNLQAIERQSVYIPTALPDPNTVKKPSEMLVRLWKNKTLFKRYNESQGGTEQTRILLDFISKEKPEAFLAYPCIRNEWPENAKHKKLKPKPMTNPPRRFPRNGEEMIDSMENDNDNEYTP